MTTGSSAARPPEADSFFETHCRVNKSLRGLTEPELAALGLYLGQDRMLGALWDADGRTPGEIAAAVHVSTPAVVKMATRMETAGLLTRRPDERDRRLVRLWLTEKGRALREPVQAIWREADTKATAGLSEAERALLASLMAKVDATLTSGE
ncbi:hypothetical protein Afil01_17100 [Actinorhabdospora filicis]|uniref:HTH marR-type domain-containing protein n=1 Tax=Actinorhabdospora filicis TaxID=1785913 RepID=A0A9W6SJ23_9ACTN|nr:MarR family transcriptional regulator [Actinorhabdospora filicis]GLZ76903.1 hypothetical protein Afil01_17100 [Actinorhabdospora filicis]